MYVAYSYLHVTIEQKSIGYINLIPLTMVILDCTKSDVALCELMKIPVLLDSPLTAGTYGKEKSEEQQRRHSRLQAFTISLS